MSESERNNWITWVGEANFLSCRFEVGSWTCKEQADQESPRMRQGLGRLDDLCWTSAVQWRQPSSQSDSKQERLLRQWVENWIKCKSTEMNSKVYTQSGFNGSEISVENFEVLISDKKLAWEPASDGSVPPGAVSTGRDGSEEIFIGRAPFKGSITVGKVNGKLSLLSITFLISISNIEFKVHPSHRCLYLPYGGREERVSHYEVLVFKKAKRKLVSSGLENSQLVVEISSRKLKITWYGWWRKKKINES